LASDLHHITFRGVVRPSVSAVCATQFPTLKSCPGQKSLLKLAAQSATLDPAIVRLLFDNQEFAVSY
jgi:hypothetical protein